MIKPSVGKEVLEVLENRGWKIAGISNLTVYIPEYISKFTYLVDGEYEGEFRRAIAVVKDEEVEVFVAPKYVIENARFYLEWLKYICSLIVFEMRRVENEKRRDV